MNIREFRSGDFEPVSHFYPRVLNAQLHPLVRHFFHLGPRRVAQRYAHLHPSTSAEQILALLRHRGNHFRWGGSDLFLATDDRGVRNVVVIETNSCPSGQKSMPLLDDADELGSYRRLIGRAMVPLLSDKSARLPQGGLCVLFDKNEMEASGYAATLAELTGEKVLLVPCFADMEVHHRFEERVLEVRHEGQWKPMRAALRYVTQRPWSRIPPRTRTLIFNPVLACLAGGRNKAMAAKAYEFFNAEHQDAGLMIRTPETIWDVGLAEVPLWVERMGGVAVVKDPYSNAGQGVYTITRPSELDAFMKSSHRYGRFIVQALIGNHRWSSRTRDGRLFHVGTIPDKRQHIFAADLRFMVASGPDGFFPVAVYARRARKPLAAEISEANSSWDMLGTNLSVRSEGRWLTETERLLLADNRDFHALGIGVDDLIEGFIQTVMSVVAIDTMACRLLTKKGVFRKRFFRGLNPDDALVDEVMSL